MFCKSFCNRGFQTVIHMDDYGRFKIVCTVNWTYKLIYVLTVLHDFTLMGIRILIPLSAGLLNLVVEYFIFIYFLNILNV